jgi:8-oxo-dGTP pyrophosphatase MutT (NUDIX family)
MDKYLFQNCQKIVVFSKDLSKVLLCKRKGEIDLDGIFTFIGGKMENTDKSILAGLKREKNEEVGASFKIKICLTYSINHLYTKKDKTRMILPHYFAVYQSGNIHLNEEYSEFKWIPIEALEKFEPKVSTIPGVIKHCGVE